MTQIRLDAATVAKIQALSGPVTFCDEAGKPVSIGRLMPASTGEPELTEEELQAAEACPVKYKLADAWEKIYRGEPL